MVTQEELEEELADAITTRALYRTARKTLVTSGTSYTIQDGDSTRQLTRVSLPQIEKEIKILDARINEIQYMLANGLNKPSRFVMLRGI